MEDATAAVMIDVRERDEFDAEHAPGAIHAPLSAFATVAPGLLAHLDDRRIVFICRSGNRARLAREQAKALGLAGAHASGVFEGGMVRWKEEGRPVRSARRTRLPLMRQVQLTAGGFVVAFAALGALVHPAFTWGAGLVGAGLFASGATGTCALGAALAKAPWNRPLAPAAEAHDERVTTAQA